MENFISFVSLSQILSILDKVIVYLCKKEKLKIASQTINCEESSYFELIVNFADFFLNNNIFMQNSCAFKNYQL